MLWYCVISMTLALLLFTAYNVYTIARYKHVPIHISESYYYLNSQHIKRYGWIFPCFVWVMALLIIPTWVLIEAQLKLPPMTYLIYIIGGCLFCIGLLREYHEHRVRKWLHYLVAYTAGLGSVIWIWLTCPIYWWIPFVLLGIFVIIGLWTRTLMVSFRYWIELVAFYSIMIVLLLLSISLL